MIKIRFHLLPLMLLAFVLAQPSEADHPGPSPTMRFHRLSIENGLSQSSVRCILQDHRGFVWLGTEDGLNRFDGGRFRVYRQEPDGTGELRNSIIWVLHEDRNGTFWVGTDGGGLERYDRDHDRFTNLVHDPEQPTSLSHNAVRAIAEDSSGNLWIGTSDGGLNRYDPETGVFTRYKHLPGDEQSLSCDVVRGLHFDPAGHLWIATYGGGLDRFNPGTGRFTHFRHDPGNPGSLASDFLRTVFVDRRGMVWVGTTDSGLDCLDPAEDRFEHHQHKVDVDDSLSNDSIWSIAEDHLGTLWVGTNDGLCQLPAHSRRQHGQRPVPFIRHRPNPEDPHSLSQGRIRCVAEDRADVLWVGTYNGGINLTERREGTFLHLRRHPTGAGSLTDNEVRAFCEAGNGEIWVGTYGGGLDLFHRETMSFTRPGARPGMEELNEKAVMSLAREASGTLWIGTESDGLIRLDPGTNRLSRYLLPGPQGQEPVRTLLVDHDGTIWAGTYGSGLYRRDATSDNFTRYSHDAGDRRTLSSEMVWALHEDASGTIWVGTNGGLDHFNRDSGDFTNFRHRPGDLSSLASDRVRAIHEDASGTLWVGTYGGGLNRFDPRTRTFTHFGAGEGLPGNVVYGITEDRMGHLWLSTNQGLTRFDPATSSVRTFHESDGLQSNEFNAGASLRASDGEMYFGGISGFNVFLPEQIEDNPHPPPVVFTDFRVFNHSVVPGPGSHGRTILQRHITEARTIALTHRDYVISFEFAALHFAALEKNEYAYRMEGFEDQWNQVGSRGYATYTNLPPGRYTFRVIAANKDGVWNRNGASLRITVLPPFWSTVWFRLLGLAVLLLAILSVHTLRTRGIRKRNQKLEEVNTRLNQQITERVKAEKARHESEQRYRILFEDSPLGVFHFDEQGVLLDCNKRFVEIAGYSRQRLVGLKLLGLAWNRRLRAAINESLQSDRIGFYEGEILSAGSGPTTQVRAMFKKITLETGDFLGAMGVVEDITEGKRLESQLRQSQKMEAVGRLAGGIAHDFNNLLTVILGYSELLLSSLDTSDPAHRQVALIDSAGRRAASVTSQLLAFSRRQILKPKVLRLNGLIGDMEKMLRPLLGESIQLVTRLESTLWAMEADPGQIEQVLMNLIINARDAMPEGGMLNIGTANTTFDEPEYHGPFSIGPGDHVVLEVSDSGSGMDRVTRRQIFEPFFTTKDKGKGTGLGLATVYGIVKQSGGFILVDSELEKGTTFRMYFPRTLKQADQAELAAGDITEHQAMETILLVEDEDAVRMLLAETLENHGYRIIEARDAESALAAVNDLDDPLHLILTDVVMPGLSGPELVERLQPCYPETRILYMSGYTDEVIVHHGSLNEEVSLLNKPLTVQELLRGVRQALGEPAVV